jgi:hypothetical protein
VLFPQLLQVLDKLVVGVRPPLWHLANVPLEVLRGDITTHSLIVRLVVRGRERNLRELLQGQIIDLVLQVPDRPGEFRSVFVEIMPCEILLAQCGVDVPADQMREPRDGAETVVIAIADTEPLTRKSTSADFEGCGFYDGVWNWRGIVEGDTSGVEIVDSCLLVADASDTRDRVVLEVYVYCVVGEALFR